MSVNIRPIIEGETEYCLHDGSLRSAPSYELSCAASSADRTTISIDALGHDDLPVLEIVMNNSGTNYHDPSQVIEVLAKLFPDEFRERAVLEGLDKPLPVEVFYPDESPEGATPMPPAEFE